MLVYWGGGGLCEGCDVCSFTVVTEGAPVMLVYTGGGVCEGCDVCRLKVHMCALVYYYTGVCGRWNNCTPFIMNKLL